ncbi:MAG TPA: lipid A biosynthesis acyltransferase [Hyphomicrobiaceae bacterium]|jgi:Kdo2-lipid IVA lauroyltransferase/acyltransferase|nr:lipid A biosynthesis acyltransferase [Hyphomicrobiaceae bacterium]
MREFLRDLRYRLEYGVLRLITGLVRAVPLDVAVDVSAKAWRKLAPYDRRHKRALANLAIAFPEKTEAEREAIALSMWENLGRIMAETMTIDRIIADPSRLEIVSERMFSRYRGKPGAAIGVTLHMGNWELAVWPLTESGKNPAAIYRAVNNPYVDRYLRWLRRDLYPGGLLGKGRSHQETQAVARSIMSFVRQGGRLGIVCDLHDGAGIPVPFFGRPAPSVAGPALIARVTGTRIWMARCVRVGKQSRFKIEIKELKVPRTANQADDVRWITAEMQKQFEAWVRETPDQWMWGNRRWS